MQTRFRTQVSPQLPRRRKHVLRFSRRYHYETLAFQVIILEKTNVTTVSYDVTSWSLFLLDFGHCRVLNKVQ